MASTEVGDPDAVLPPPKDIQAGPSTGHAERVSEDIENSKAVHSERVDRELAQYVGDSGIVISPERSVQLRRMIDKRVLVVMVSTYFLQAIDKGTLSFASIMGITKDTGLEDDQGNVKQTVRLAALHVYSHVYWYLCLPSHRQVFLAYDLYLHRHLDSRIPAKLHHCPSSHCKIPQLQYYCLGYGVSMPRCL